MYSTIDAPSSLAELRLQPGPQHKQIHTDSPFSVSPTGPVRAGPIPASEDSARTSTRLEAGSHGTPWSNQSHTERRVPDPNAHGSSGVLPSIRVKLTMPNQPRRAAVGVGLSRVFSLAVGLSSGRLSAVGGVVGVCCSVRLGRGAARYETAGEGAGEPFGGPSRERCWVSGSALGATTPGLWGLPTL